MSLVGQVVFYWLSRKDARVVNVRRRNTVMPYGSRGDEVPALSAFNFHGDAVKEGQKFPLLVVDGTDSGRCVSGHVFLNGQDTLWVRGVARGRGSGEWSVPTVKRRNVAVNKVRVRRESR